MVLRQKFGLMSEAIVLAIACLILPACSDANAKYIQCEQIFKIAHQVNQEAKDIESMNTYIKDISQDMKDWLKAADLMEQAAQQIQALSFNSAELIKYQTGLANIYQIYSQATYDAVQARETKNINALISARDRALTAGKIQQKLVRNINNYCLSQ